MVACLMLFLPASTAQVLEDDLGDVELHAITGAEGTVPAGLRDAVDIQTLTVEENQDQLVFTLKLAAIQPSSDLDGVEARVQFQIGQMEYLLSARIPGNVPGYDGIGAGWAKRAVGSIAWDGIGPIDITLDPGTPALLSWKIPRSELLNEFGFQPRAGDQLSRFQATTQDGFSEATLVSAVGTGLIMTVIDHAPDSGIGTGVFTFQIDPPVEPSIQLNSPQPIRTSNGEAGAIVFETYVKNEQGTLFEGLLSASNIPEKWSVDIPQSAITLQPGESRPTPVVATIPFAHAHGSMETLLVALTDLDGTKVDELELGIKFHAIPQPAGHHNQLWLHNRFDGAAPAGGLQPDSNTAPFMSTVEEDERSAGGNILPTGFDDPQVTTRFDWCIPLSPGLDLGLDWQNGALGSGSLVLESGAPLQGDLGAKLLVAGGPKDAGFSDTAHCSRGEKVMAAADAVALDLPAMSEQDISLTFAANLQTLDYGMGRDLYLYVSVTTTQPTTHRAVDVPRLQPGGSLDLPLNEYYDAAPILDTVGARLHTPEAAVARTPGGIAVFPVTATGFTDDIALVIVGTHTDWAVLSTTKIAKEGFVEVQIEVPSDALDGDRADLIVRGSDIEGNTALLRLVLEVDTDEEWPSDSRISFAGNVDSPGAGLVAIVLVIALMSANSRRR